MKIIFKLLNAFILGSIATAFASTGFKMEREGFTDPTREITLMYFIGGLVLLIIGIFLYHLAFKPLIKYNNKRWILTGLIAFFTITVYLIKGEEFKTISNKNIKKMNQEIQNADKGIETLGDTKTYHYKEKLVEFSTPFKLQEKAEQDSVYILKNKSLSNIAVTYWELNEKIFSILPVENQQEFLSNIDNYSIQKEFLVLLAKENMKIDILDADINVQESNEQLAFLSFRKDGYEGTMIAQRQGFAISSLTIITKIPEGEHWRDEISESIHFVQK